MYQLGISRLFAIMPRIQTARKCQRYSQRWLCTLSVITQIITDFLKFLPTLIHFLILFLLNALLSLFLTAYHYSHRYQSQCHRRLPNLNVPYFEWHWMSSSDTHTHTYIYIYMCVCVCVCVCVNLRPEAINILKLWGCSTWISTRSCGVKEQSVQYTSHFFIHSMQAMAICTRNGSSCLNSGILRVLESWPLLCELLMHLCMVVLWLFNKDEVCWHILLTAITYLPLQRRCVEKCFIIFP